MQVNGFEFCCKKKLKKQLCRRRAGCRRLEPPRCSLLLSLFLINQMDQLWKWRNGYKHLTLCSPASCVVEYLHVLINACVCVLWQEIWCDAFARRRIRKRRPNLICFDKKSNGQCFFNQPPLNIPLPHAEAVDEVPNPRGSRDAQIRWR